MYRIINFKNYHDPDAAIRYYHGQWGGPDNFAFFEDAMRHASDTAPHLPRFYVLLNDQRIVGCCGLITADFISRGDLSPWICGIFVDPSERGQQLGSRLIAHAAAEAASLGFAAAYINTDHDGYYERYGWQRIEDGYDLFSGQPTRIYRCALPQKA